MIIKQHVSKKLQSQRINKPIEELERKANKSTRKSKLWTQEEIDLAIARGNKLAKFFKETKDAGTT